jgi:hypothetical protein
VEVRKPRIKSTERRPRHHRNSTPTYSLTSSDSRELSRKIEAKIRPAGIAG